MLFNSAVFVLLFLPVTLAGFYLAGWRGRRAALLWLLLASLFFYAWWQPVMVCLLLISIVGNFFIGRRIRATRPARRWMVAGVAANLGTLALFKYLPGILRLHAAPLGISFFTFQQVMFVVDTYSGALLAASFLEYACFVAFFPHLIAGPIVQPAHIIPQFDTLQPLRHRREEITAGLEIFLLGLAKKLVLADSLARFADPGFAAAAQGSPLSLIEAWVALLAYGLQIYFDFSGYSDMAIGLARMFGIAFPLNFNSPYQARDISDFWRRWNITLSAFLRNYLYIPLGGNRRGEARRIINLLTTMLLGGLWHGAGLKFVLWGGLHGLFLIVHGWFRQSGRHLPRGPAWAITLLCVLLAWVPFRAANFHAALNFYRGLAGLNGLALPALLVDRLPALGRISHVVPVLPYLGDARTLSLPQGLMLLTLGWFIALALPPLHIMGQRRRATALVASFALSLQALIFAPYTIPFLYFQF
jgi:D-alanyl-lipoteichoic acid acyltransferase DltB (MBOAT superfamily)